MRMIRVINFVINCDWRGEWANYHHRTCTIQCKRKATLTFPHLTYCTLVTISNYLLPHTDQDVKGFDMKNSHKRLLDSAP